MEQDHIGLWIVSIVAIVAIIGLVMLYSHMRSEPAKPVVFVEEAAGSEQGAMPVVGEAKIRCRPYCSGRICGIRCTF